MLKITFPYEKKKDGRRGQGGGKKKRKSQLKLWQRYQPTKVKNYKHQELNKIENLYHSFSTMVNYIQSQF